MKRALTFLTSLLLAGTASAAPLNVFFAPSTTDPAITEFNNVHYAVVDPAVTSRGRLVLFLPGTNAIPYYYQDFPLEAAGFGFHALGLMYPNDKAINDYANAYAPYNPDAAGNARLEVIDGTDRVSFLSVDATNCIEHRLIKALQYLNATYPARGWGQFFSGDTVLWEKLVVCGHSQGGGMAAMLAKTRVTNRCITFGNRDWWVAGNRPVNWMFAVPQTPVDRWFLFAHERDEKASFAEVQPCAGALDVTRFGAYVRVETAGSPDYGGRHFLSTDLESNPVLPGRYHDSLVVDGITPLQADGVTPVFKPVWDYLLLHDTPPIAIESTGSSASVIFSPGTLEQSDDLASWTAQPAAVSPLTLPFGTPPSRRFYRLRFPTP